MTFTLIQFVKDALKEMGIIAASETPTAQDSLDVKNALEQVLANLENEGLETWYYEDGRIPSLKYRPLIALVCNELKGSYGINPQEFPLYETKARQAISDLRRHTDDYLPEPVKFSNI